MLICLLNINSISYEGLKNCKNIQQHNIELTFRGSLILCKELLQRLRKSEQYNQHLGCNTAWTMIHSLRLTFVTSCSNTGA